MTQQTVDSNRRILTITVEATECEVLPSDYDEGVMTVTLTMDEDDLVVLSKGIKEMLGGTNDTANS